MPLFAAFHLAARWPAGRRPRRDSNTRPLAPQASALSKLSGPAFHALFGCEGLLENAAASVLIKKPLRRALPGSGFVVYNSFAEPLARLGSTVWTPQKSGSPGPFFYYTLLPR
jgi:hypothetical protein